MSYPVKLYVYDLSNGLAKSVSLNLTGTYIEGIWHTSVVVFDQEIFYGQGVFMVKPGSTHHGQPLKIIDLGTTDIPPEVFFEYLEELKGTYTAANYHLLEFNCNTFSNEVVGFLNGSEIPSYIKNLPADFMNTPFGQMIRPQIDSFFGAGRSQTAPLNAFGTVDPATILDGFTSQVNTQNTNQLTLNNIKIEVLKPSELQELQTLIKDSTMLIVIVEIPDCNKTSSTEEFLKKLIASYANSQAVKDKFPSFTVPKVALVTSERTLAKDRIEDQQSVVVQFFSKGVEVNRTNNFNPSVLQGCFEFTILKTYSDIPTAYWDSSLATINKTPKLLDSTIPKEEFIEAISSVSSSLENSNIISIWDSIVAETFEFSLDNSSQFASELISVIKQLEEQSNADYSATLLKGVGYLSRHPRISSSLASSSSIQELYSSLLKIFSNSEVHLVKEAILGLSLNLFSSHLCAQISSSVIYPLKETSPSPLNQLTQIIISSLFDDQLKTLAIKLAFNLMLHITQSSLLSDNSKNLVVEKLPGEISQNTLQNFFELEDGEIWAMEFFSTLTQSLTSSDDIDFITCLVETLVIAQSRLSLTSSQTIIPALSQSLNFEDILNQKTSHLDITDKSKKFMSESAKFITGSQ